MKFSIEDSKKRYLKAELDRDNKDDESGLCSLYSKLLVDVMGLDNRSRERGGELSEDDREHNVVENDRYDKYFKIVVDGINKSDLNELEKSGLNFIFKKMCEESFFETNMSMFDKYNFPFLSFSQYLTIDKILVDANNCVHLERNSI